MIVTNAAIAAANTKAVTVALAASTAAAAANTAASAVGRCRLKRA